MGVYINGIEMPKGADEHRLIIRANGQVIIDKKTYWEEAEAVPVPPHGEWYGEADGYSDGELVYDTWSCGCCGKYFPEWDEKPDWRFCPNCGADMRGDKDV